MVATGGLCVDVKYLYLECRLTNQIKIDANIFRVPNESIKKYFGSTSNR